MYMIMIFVMILSLQTGSTGLGKSWPGLNYSDSEAPVVYANDLLQYFYTICFII